MNERRAIVFGEEMRERDCRLLGYIGALGIMSSIGVHNLAQRPVPVINKNATMFRHLCEMLARDKYNEARTRLENADVDEPFCDMALVIQLLRTSVRPSSGRNISLDGHARMAFDFMQGKSPYYIPDRRVPDVQDVFEFHRKAALHRYTSVVEITADQTEGETDVIRKVLRDIEYDIKYV